MKTFKLLLIGILFSIESFGPIRKSPSKEVYISKVPKPTAPANLEVTSISFSDQNGNRNSILDGGEKAVIAFTLSNLGKGDGYNLVAEIAPVGTITGIEVPREYQIGNLISGKNTIVSVLLSATLSLESGSPNLRYRLEKEMVLNLI